jgi:hypothetical protein
MMSKNWEMILYIDAKREKKVLWATQRKWMEKCQLRKLRRGIYQNKLPLRKRISIILMILDCLIELNISVSYINITG